MDSIINVLDEWSIIDYVIAGLIGAVIAFLFNMVISFFSIKRKKYNLSKSLVSSSVYEQTEEDGLKIKVLYNNIEVDGPLSIMKICIKNDGMEDLVYSKRIKNLFLKFDDMDVLCVSVSSEVVDVLPVVIPIDADKYEIKWDLLKCDECIMIKVVAKGKEIDFSKIKFEIRADGISKIKTPEYKVNEVMRPILISDILIVVPILLFYPSSTSFIGIMPMKVFMLLILSIMTIMLWVTALLKRIKWLKEQ
jgi:hypothetical protein